MENKQKKKSFLDRFMVWLLAVLRKSFLGKFFTSYYTANNRFVKRKRPSKRRSNKRLARFIERNRVLRAVPKLTQFLLRLPLRDYGIMLFMTGIVVTVLYPLNNMILFIDITFEMFVLGASTSVCAIPLLFSSRSLASNILSSKFFGFILFDFLGMDKENFRAAAEKEKISFATFAFLIGTGLGVLSYFIMPVGTVLIVLGLALAYCTIRTPEVGAILTVLLIPYVSIYVTCVCIAYTFVCYVIKVLLGKRIFKFEYFDLWVSLAILAFTVCGFNYVSPSFESVKNVVLNLAIWMAYFLYSNLIYSKVWFRRSIVAFTTSSLVVALVAVVQLILRNIAGSAEAVGKVFPADGDIVSTLGSSTVLAQFMVIAIPFALVHMISERKDITKFGGFIMAGLLITALVLTDSAIGLFGLLVGALLIFAFYKRVAIYLLVIVSVALPVLYFTLPEAAISAITSAGPLEGISVTYELMYVKDSFLTIIKHPLGANLSGGDVLSVYGVNGFDSQPLQLLADYGVIGFAAFVLMLVMFVRVILSYSVKAKNAYRRVNGCAGLCSILALLTVGVFNNAWSDKKILLMFVITMALSFVYVKIDREEEGVMVSYVDITTATVDIPLRETYTHTSNQQRRYVHVQKMKKNLKRQGKIKVAEAKEFSNTEELIIKRRKYEENETEEQND